MDKFEELYKNLERHSNFDENDNSEKFLDTVDEIILKQDINSLPYFLKYFKDDSDYGWILESLSKAIEHYPRDLYIIGLFKNLDNLLEQSPYWANIIFNRIFNSQEYVNALRFCMHHATKESLLKLFDIMEQESPHHRELIVELRQELGGV